MRTRTMTQILPVDLASILFSHGLRVADKTTLHHLQVAASTLQKSGGVVGFPTETVYGLGGSALDDASVQAIYTAKNRPADNPLIVHVASVEQLERKLLAPGQKIPAIYHKLIEKFWPGPLTILLPIQEGNGFVSPISKYVTAGQHTVGVRLPSHPVARALISLSDTPLAAPSANALTRPSPTLASHVYHDLKDRIPFIVDGGPSSVGVESTVVDGLVDPPMLLRPGGVLLEQLKEVDGWANVIKAKKTAGKLEQVKTPGMKYRHYSPTARVVLLNGSDGDDAVAAFLSDNKDKKVAFLRTKCFAPVDGVVDRHLGSTGAEISRNLFAMLREVDELGVDVILVEAIEEDNEGLAVMNRLSKAASN